MKSMRLYASVVLSMMTAATFRVAAQSTPPPTSFSAAPAPGSPAGAGSPVAPAPADGSGPIIQVDQGTFDFGKAQTGEKVHHTYILTNTGNATLHITNVQPSCHCTTAGDWTHDIEPGKTGQIPVQLDTTGFGGGAPVQRMVTVYSNAKNDPRKLLVIKGIVWKPIETTPGTAVISVAPDGSNAVTTVRLVNRTENPVTFSNPVSTKSFLAVTLKEIKPGQEAELVITAQPPFNPGSSWGAVTVNTTLSNTPTINVPVMLSVVPAVQVYPGQIVMNLLPGRWTTNRVTIHGTTTNLLSLSNPKASDSRVQVQVLPMGPKGMYNLLVAFPPDFQLEPGKSAEVTVESNHPRFPVLKIPIVQYTHRKPVVTGAPHPISGATPVAAFPANTNAPQAAAHP
ncbi:MAG TPA: DUF1573 domain-containing protein [Verrucomicrobiae bacterium]|jgi:hypothetical protein|nr:DUF1573 domain-containing protein [Verrucomicrobiae bacterium]